MLPLDKAHPRQYNQYCYGPVAQLGAHYIRIVGVGSSNLLRSTNKNHPIRVVFCYGIHMRRFEDSNAVRMSTAGEGLTKPNNYFR